MATSKWMATVASIWIQCSSGASYTFGIYSSTLKSSQSYDQSTLDTVSVFKDIGANAGVLSGVLYSSVALNSRRPGGPWVVHLAGAIQSFVGFFLMWAAVAGLISRPPVALMCVFMFLAAHGQTFFNTANVVSGVRNFHDYGGTIVGIMKGFLGLSGAILIQVYNTWCGGNPTTYILILALTPTLVSLLLMPFVRVHETSSLGDKKYLNGFSAIALIIAAYLMIIIILDNVVTLPFWARILTFVFLLLLLALPLGVANEAQKENRDSLDLGQPTCETSPLLESLKGPLLQRHIESHNMPFEDKTTKDDEQDVDLLRATLKMEFWMLFIAMVCGMGTGLATINNISQIGESLRYSTVEISSLVSLWSIWNFLGRFGAGFVSDIFLHKRGWPRPLFMVITLATMTIGHLVVASGFSGNLYLGSILVGICYGSQWSLMPTITSDVFGVRHMGTIFNTISIASPIGSYIFSVRVIGFFYDKEASGVDDSCFGTHCFMVSFLIMASVAFVGFLVAFALFFRTRGFYREVVLGRLRH